MIAEAKRGENSRNRERVNNFRRKYIKIESMHCQLFYTYLKFGL